MAYRRKTDYRELIDKAAAKGNYREAARLEAQRNEKIRNEGMSFKPTSDYAGWLDKNDYSDRIRTEIGSGGSRRDVAELLGRRINKASSTKGMEKWLNDDVYDMAMDYITGEDRESYGDRIDVLLSGLQSREPFSYDYRSDPLYQAYAEAYGNESRRAAENALGLASENTGGYASSYAAGAAKQAGSYYGAKQAEIIPKLYRLAYEVYQDDIENDFKEIGLLSDLRDKEYDRYRDDREDEMWRQEFDYEREQDALDRDWDRDKLEYDRGRDRLEDERYEKEWQYRLQRDRIKDSRYKGGSGGRVRGSSGEEDEEREESGKGGKKKVRIYGLKGMFTQMEAEALVLGGVAEKVKSNGKIIYKVPFMG